MTNPSIYNRRSQRDRYGLKYYGISLDPVYVVRRAVIVHFGYDARTTREVDSTIYISPNVRRQGALDLK